MAATKGTARSRTTTFLSWLLPLFGLVSGIAASAQPAFGLPITVKINLKSIEDVDQDLDEGVVGIEADFEGRVNIGGQEFNVGYKENDDTWDLNETYTKDIEHTNASVPVSILITERDGNVFNGADDSVDVSPGGDDVLNFNVDLHLGSPCVTGEITGPCNATDLTSTGDRSENAKIIFTVDVTIPVTVGGSHVRCTHTPAWPQPGDTVTITAEALGDQPASDPGNLNLDADMPAQLVPSIEVWTSTDGGATRTKTKSDNNVSTETATPTAGAGGSTLSYGCLVNTNSGPIFSGWRSTTIGNPPPTGTPPVPSNVVAISVGESERKDALDIVLVPATRNALNTPGVPASGTLAQNPYSGPSDPAFLAEASRILQQEVFRHQVYLDGQRRLNVWLLLDGGVAANKAAVGGFRDLRNAAGNIVDTTVPPDGVPDGDGVADTCHVELPANNATDASWSNGTAVVHRNGIRDCAPGGGVFTSEQGEDHLLPHEFGHAGFGMADEYCCDGGYFQANPFPNTFMSLAACQNDPLYSAAAGVCDGYEALNENPPTATPDFWVGDPSDADPNDNDLMNNNQTPQAADIRRINWMFNTQCPAHLC